MRDMGIFIGKQSGMDLMGTFLSDIVLQVLKVQKNALFYIISMSL